ncbi:MAG: tail fiber domain-containing protein, partial [Flavobacteriaceae bacterium]|nr:tail fiber domain-containing protein [Flavobacteriaceae bacterium]
SNSAFGSGSLKNNTEGRWNNAIGIDALYYNTTGDNNSAAGRWSLILNTTGSNNTAIGGEALSGNTTGNNNVAVGAFALSETTIGSNNIGIGYGAQIPNGTSHNQVRIGNTDVTYAGVQVGWTVTSDESWKKDVRELPYGLDFVSKLKPVDYIRKNNDKETREMGFIAQDVEQVLKDLGYDDQGFLTTDDEGRMSLRYNDLIALLTKAIQEQQVIISEQDNEINGLKTELTEIKELQNNFEKRMSSLEKMLNFNEQ